MDFVVANGGTNDLWIYLGNGDGTFQLPQIIPLTKGLTPVALATADLRGIGVLDLIVAEFDTSTIGVLLGNGDGTFGYEQEYSLPQPPGALVISDFNLDGKLDIGSAMVTVNPTGPGVPYIAILLGDGTGSFGSPIISSNLGIAGSPDSIAAGDVNNDGLPDLLVTDPGAGISQVYLNAGSGEFTVGAAVVGSGLFNLPLAGTLGDVNGDGCLDAIVGDADGYVWTSLGQCNGSFATPTYVPTGDSNAAVAFVDMNGDGNPDIVTTTVPDSNAAYGGVAGNMLTVSFGDGKGNFSSGQDYVGTGLSYSLAIADFNGDGHPDVVSVSPQTDTATVYLNNGSGGFGLPQGEWIGLPGVGVLNAPISAPSFGDLNGDGTPDMLIMDEGFNGEYFITTMLNNGSGQFSAPVASDAGVAFPNQLMGDYRLGDFRNTGNLDFVGIGPAGSDAEGGQFIVFAPGNGNGTFGKATFTSTAGAGGAIGVGDFNGDGKLDFVAVSGNGTGWLITVFLGNGDGTFRNAGNVAFTDLAQEISRVFIGDFNRDGKLDVLVYDTGNGYFTTSSYVWEFLGNGNGTFQPGKQLFSDFQPMTMADINGDSWLDIVSYNFFWPNGTTQTYGLPTFTSYLDQPSGTFLESSSYTPYGGIPEEPPPYLEFGDPMTSSLAADTNGDGKPDETAYQWVSQSDPDAYAQILMGNGDGTFTPTYDVFDFQKDYFFPPFAYLLDGSGYTDLIEIDAATSSMHIFRTGGGPTVQLALEESQVTGTSGCGWLFLNVASTSDTSVSLSSGVAGVILPASVTIPAGALSQQFCYTLSSNYNWQQVFDIQAQLGTTTAVAYAFQTYVVGFSEALSPNSSQIIYPGQSTAPMTVSLTAAPGYTSTVQLNCQGLPTGATCVFGSNTLSISPAAIASTTLVINTTTTTQGSATVTVIASDSNIISRQSFNLTVQPLIVNSFGNVQTTSPGTGTSAVGIEGIPPYTLSCGGLPAGVTCAFSSNQTQQPIAMTLQVPVGISVGSYPFTVQVLSGPESGSAAYTLNIGDFSLQPPTPISDWAPPGGTVGVSAGIQAINEFSGTVNFTCSLDVGGSCTGTSVLMGGGPGSAPVNLTVTVPSGAPVGSHILTLTATSGPLTHTATFPFVIADYSGSLSQTNVTMTGGSASLTATVTATAGFAGTIYFSCTGTTKAYCMFSPPTVQPTAGNPAQTEVEIIGSSQSSNRMGSKTQNRMAFIVLGLPFGLAFCIASHKNASRARVLLILLSTASILTALSCGGGGSTPGGGSTAPSSSQSATYSLTVNASAGDTNTSRVLGTVTVTVTQ